MIPSAGALSLPLKPAQDFIALCFVIFFFFFFVLAFAGPLRRESPSSRRTNFTGEGLLPTQQGKSRNLHAESGRNHGVEGISRIASSRGLRPWCCCVRHALWDGRPRSFLRLGGVAFLPSADGADPARLLPLPGASVVRPPLTSSHRKRRRVHLILGCSLHSAHVPFLPGRQSSGD
ncbi:uncharacterized protein LOC126409304 [Nymphaea colorata]|nr:uncharacterized protein LOC126409276 [Nymphaea colorata]XP_049931327.1 uncharacterized protein LOC126409304 [Nymphaea colorata]